MEIKNKKHIYVTGMGVLSSIAQNVSDFYKALISGKSGISYSNNFTVPSLTAINITAEINDFNFIQQVRLIPDISYVLFKAILRIAKTAPLTLQTSIVVALQAWYNSGFHNSSNFLKPIQPDRIGLIIGGHNTTQNYQYMLNEKFHSHPEYFSPRYALQFMDSYQIGVLSEIFNIQGEGLVCGGASASGNIAIIQALRLIRFGIVDVCLVIGVMADFSPMEIQSFYTLGAMGGKKFFNNPKKACRPFDLDREGFIYGQGAGCLILESDASVNNRKVLLKKLIVLVDGAVTLHATSLAEPNYKSEIKVMNLVLKKSRFKKTDIDYLNTHGSSSVLGDKIELKAIKKVFGTYFSKLWLNSTKGLIGHCLYSAGIIEAIATIIQMKKNFIHPNLNLDHPIILNARFSGSSSIDNVNINKAMSNSFGFSGINTSIIFQKI